MSIDIFCIFKETANEDTAYSAVKFTTPFPISEWNSFMLSGRSFVREEINEGVERTSPSS